MPNEKTIPKLTINEIDSLEVWEYLKNNNLISDDELYLINAEGILSIFLKGKEYTDEQITSLINSAPETLDTLGELALAFEENSDIVEILNQAITEKYSLDNPPPYPVTSVQGKTGAVVLASETWTFTLSDGSTVTKKVLLG